MSAIGPGDFVECVDASPSLKTGERLSVGAIYQVREVLRGPGMSGRTENGVRLVGQRRCLNRQGVEYAWRADRFRPIYRPKSSLIEQLKRPVGEPA